MKRGTIEHHKTADLMQELKIPRYAAVGILESLWHATSKYAIRGDIGHLTDKQIAHHVGWDGDPSAMVRALVASRWLDEHPEYRLVVHDWHDHADEATKKTAKNRGLTFVSGTFKKVPEVSGLPLPLPLPSPEPLPEPCREEIHTHAAAGGSEPADTDKIPLAWLDELWRWWPRQRKIGQGAAYPEMESAIRRVAHERGSDLIQAHGWLLDRVKAYARSGVVAKGPAQFIPAPAKWFHEGRFNDDEKAWEYTPAANGKETPEQRRKREASEQYE